METVERIIRWFSQTSFYQKFCVNLPVPFNNAYFNVVFLMILGVIVVWTAADRIHLLGFRLRVRRKKESALGRQLERDAKEQERKNQMEAINQNNLLYMQFLQTAMLSHIVISEPAFEAWKRENGFVSLEQAKPEIEPDPETISEDMEKESRNVEDGNKSVRNEAESNGARVKEVGQKEVGAKAVEKNRNRKKEAADIEIKDTEIKDTEIKDTEGCCGQENPVNPEKAGYSGKQCQKRKRTCGNEDFAIECTDIEQDLGDVPDIELPVLLEDECVHGMAPADEKNDQQMLSFDELYSKFDDGNEDNGDNADNSCDTGIAGNGSNDGSSDSVDGNARCEGQDTANGILERQSTFDLLMENMIRMEAVRKKQNSMQEEADKVISHNISVLDGQIQSALQVESEADEGVEESREARQLEALEAERRRIEREGNRKRFRRKKDGD